ncbi:MAG: hypothetical protein HC922_06875, partial [Leptolyngbyaceae cyanobacterium SM2_3_12]|nr:hypothetical protein [Leptolyngbyaceae cyanobacterium SM2_3_12]
QAPEAVVYHRHRQSLGELRRQWYRYGCSNRYLHELHGVPLSRALTVGEMGYRLLRWVGKELPQTLVKDVSSQGNDGAWFTWFTTPLDLWCAQARSQGQRRAQLPDMARDIAWLEEPHQPKHSPELDG